MSYFLLNSGRFELKQFYAISKEEMMIISQVYFWSLPSSAGNQVDSWNDLFVVARNRNVWALHLCFFFFLYSCHEETYGMTWVIYQTSSFLHQLVETSPCKAGRWFSKFKAAESQNSFADRLMQERKRRHCNVYLMINLINFLGCLFNGFSFDILIWLGGERDSFSRA